MSILSDYYETVEWREIRADVLNERGPTCERCGTISETPHIHHVYGLSHDVFEVLCPECHAEHHGDREIAYFHQKKKKTYRIYEDDTHPISIACALQSKWDQRLISERKTNEDNQ